jgi:hypothetical protein
MPGGASCRRVSAFFLSNTLNVAKLTSEISFFIYRSMGSRRREGGIHLLIFAADCSGRAARQR